MATKKKTEMPLKEMLAKRFAIWKKLVDSPTPMNWNDVYGISTYSTNMGLVGNDLVPKGTIIVLKSKRSNNICGIGIFSNDGFMRMTPIYFADKYYDAAKVGDIIDAYIYNETTGTIRLCVTSWFDRHTNKFLNELIMPKWYTNIELQGIFDIGSEDVKV